MRRFFFWFFMVTLFSCSGGDEENIINNTNNVNNTNNINNSNNTNNVTTTTGECFKELLAQAPFSPRAGHTVTAVGDSLYLVGGFTNHDGTAVALNDVWKSGDGLSWIQLLETAPFEPRTSHCAVSFQDRLWIMGGNRETDYYNDVWSSPDGITWNLERGPQDAGFSDRKGFTCLVFDSRIFILGGVDYGGLAQVWSSADGSTWTLHTDAPWAGRAHHVSWVADGRMWVAGGHVYTTEYYNDVWSSADSESWVQEVEALPVATLYGHSAFYTGERVVITGGNGNEDGVMVSPDGRLWQALPERISRRSYHTSTWFKGRGFLFGGSYTENMGIYLRNDVWATCQTK
ncbi:hypothetical protein KKF84_11465 [Myxococcota bacterium]|nr:hypothetical protein [Myxococcota bacterium]MBU1535930.1 hypothetical protein [Myxococcota bacterium]